MDRYCGEANDVLIQYAVAIGTGAAQYTLQDIALVEMAGDRRPEDGGTTLLMYDQSGHLAHAL
jgi:hypothetical protein